MAAGKKPRQEMNSVIRENGVEVKGKLGIIGEYKSEFEHRLRSRCPEAGWEEHVRLTNEIIRKWLKSDCISSAPFTLEKN